MRRIRQLGPALLLVTVGLLAAPAARAEAAGRTPPRAFGVYVDPWHVGEWSRSVGITPQYVGRFEAFSRGTTVDGFLREAERQGLRRVLVTWEPWRPVPAELGVVEQFRPQPGYRNRDIARGAQDAYLTLFAQSLASFRGRVDLRYAHEMNGTWYRGRTTRSGTGWHGGTSSGSSGPPARATCASCGRRTRASISRSGGGRGASACTGRAAATSTPSARR